MNKVSLIGRICNDLEVKTAGENKYLRFSLAVNRKVKKEDGTRDADFISCVAWNRSAEVICEYFHKGSPIGINGRIQTGSYELESGKRVYTTDIIVEDFDFLEKKSEGRPAPEYTEVTNNNTSNTSTKEQVPDPYAEFGQQINLNDFPNIDEEGLPF